MKGNNDGRKAVALATVGPNTLSEAVANPLGAQAAPPVETSRHENIFHDHALLEAWSDSSHSPDNELIAETPKSIQNSLSNELFQGAVTNQYSCAAVLEFSSESQTLMVKGENCVFYGAFKIIALTLMGLIIWHTIASKNIHETLIWLFNSTSSPDFPLWRGEMGC